MHAQCRERVLAGNLQPAITSLLSAFAGLVAHRSVAGGKAGGEADVAGIW